MAYDSSNMIDPSSKPTATSSTGTTISFDGVVFHTHPTMNLYGTFDVVTGSYSGVYVSKGYQFGYSLNLYANDTLIITWNSDNGEMPNRIPDSGSYSGTFNVKDSSPTFTLRLYCGSQIGGDICDMHGTHAYDAGGINISKPSLPYKAGNPTLTFAANRTTSNSMVLGISCPYSTVGSYEVYYRRHPGNTGNDNTGSYVACYLVTTATGTAQNVTRIDNASSNPTYYAFPPRRMNQNYNYDYIVKTFWWGASSGNRFFTVFGRSVNNNGGSVVSYWCDNKGYNTNTPGIYPLLVKPTKKISLNIVAASTKVTATTIQIEVNVNIYSTSTLYLAVDKSLTITKGGSQTYMQDVHTISNANQTASLAGTTSTAESGNGIKKTFKVTGLSVYEYHTFNLLACDGYNYTQISQSIRTTFPFVRIYDTTSKTFKRAMPYICDGASWTPYQAYIYTNKFVGMNPDD